MKGSAAMAKVIEPYTEALMSLAQSQNLVDRLGEDAAAVLSVITESEQLSTVLNSPVYEGGQKKAILKQIFENQVDHHFLNFLLLLVDRQRIAFLPGICQRYRELLRDLNQVSLAEVTSAVELTEEQRQAVCDRVKSMTGAQSVEIESRVDPDLIGGVIIQVGSQVVDASLRGQLRRISLNLSRP
ncbi:MAG: F0F1 ATP synthase subunit delta [Synechococcales cyanobacterium RU_4_20]|nr:F0F1 ATP synthase subunit delta [Synechococcales cyanobacterium RU_4_20]NJR67275.1 F0F1 ATP synthase subunit delta [Synechococcales cyanobacterium CRU_2_2]